MSRRERMGERWRAAMLASSLSPAQRLVLLVAAEGMTAAGDVPFPLEELADRLRMAPRTIRDHRDAARLAGWLSDKPTIVHAPGRSACYRIQIATRNDDAKRAERSRKDGGRWA